MYATFITHNIYNVFNTFSNNPNTSLYDFIYLPLEGFVLFFIVFNIIKITKFNLRTDNINELQHDAQITLHNVTINLIQLLIGIVGYVAGILWSKKEEIENIVDFFKTYFLENSKILLFNSCIIVDFYSNFFKMIILISFIIILLSSNWYIKFAHKPLNEYPILVLSVCFFLFTLLASNNLFASFVSIVGFSLSIYVLICINANNQRTREAGIKYFYLSAYSSAYLIFGVAMSYMVFSTCTLTDIAFILQNLKFEKNSDFSGLVTLMVVALAMGFFFKLAAFPAHFWVAEIYDGCPQVIMAIFVLPIKIAVLAFFYKLFIIILKDIEMIWSFIVYYGAFWSMFFGALLALNERKLRKFIAYSSLNQMGFLLTAVVGGCTKTFEAGVFFLFIYILMNIVLFIILLNTFEIDICNPMSYMTDLAKFSDNSRVFKLILTLIFFSMAGIPPLAGFFSKYYVLLTLFEIKMYSLVIMGLVTTMLSTFYYLKVIILLNFEENKTDYKYNVNVTKTLYFIILSICFFLSAFIFLQSYIIDFAGAIIIQTHVMQ